VIHRSGLAALTLAALASLPAMAPPPTDHRAAPGTLPPPNPIVRENQLHGTRSWRLSAPDVTGTVIMGYASLVSVLRGSQIRFMVSTRARSFRADIYRMGWYRGAGARHLKTFARLGGHLYPVPPPARATGMVNCTWPAAFRLTVPLSWPSGVYLVKLTAASGPQSYIPFLVRTLRHSRYLFVRAVNTDEAYNDWGGKSLYDDLTAPRRQEFARRARWVSFNRPSSQAYGAGQFFFWEYSMVRWLERNGYNVAYTTDVDIDQDRRELLRHQLVMVVGHNEYWSAPMRASYEAAVRARVNLAVFAADTGYWLIRYQPFGGTPDRIIICYKFPAAHDPELTVDPAQVTTEWRQPPVNRPESMLLGAMYGGMLPENRSAAWIVHDARNWIFQGTGLRNGDALRGLVGYEYDTVVVGEPHPPGLAIVASSPLGRAGKQTGTANATIYTASSGAWVFNAGTMEWSWGLDSFVDPNTWGSTELPHPLAAVPRITANLLAAVPARR
jgi:hypothetical protein